MICIVHTDGTINFVNAGNDVYTTAMHNIHAESYIAEEFCKSLALFECGEQHRTNDVAYYMLNALRVHSLDTSARNLCPTGTVAICGINFTPLCNLQCIVLEKLHSFVKRALDEHGEDDPVKLNVFRNTYLTTIENDALWTTNIQLISK